MKVGNTLQQLHHTCLKLKHAFRSRHPRIHLRDTQMTRSITGILMREGVVDCVMIGDGRGPFVDLLSQSQQMSISGSSGSGTSSGTSGNGGNGGIRTFADLLTEEQKQRMKVLQMTQKSVSEIHNMFGSDGSQLRHISSSDNNATTGESVFADGGRREQLLRIFGGRQDLINAYFPLQTNKSNNYTDNNNEEVIRVIPSLKSIKDHIPHVEMDTHISKVTAGDLEKVTWARDRRLWIDLHYSSSSSGSSGSSGIGDGSGAVTDVFLVSKGSRRVYMSLRGLYALLGRSYNHVIYSPSSPSSSNNSSSSNSSSMVMSRYVWTDDPRSVVVIRNRVSGAMMSVRQLLTSSSAVSDTMRDGGEDEPVFEVLCVAK